MTPAALTSTRARRLLKVRGVVQGVGFRPTVYRIAVENGLCGFVRNDPDGVTIEVEGPEGDVAAFGDMVRSRAPVAARIEEIDIRELPLSGERRFRVEESRETSSPVKTSIPPDRGTCDDCFTELSDPRNRRFRYPFITCTNCGPRFTIVRDLPYDRSRTSMSSFILCASCRAEYEDPLDRRFHAETNACAACGPKVELIAGGKRWFADEAVQEAIQMLRSGQILAVKGIGGFHLAVDAANERAVSRLRERKSRPEKPFAVMVRNIEVAARVAFIDDTERTTLLDPARPIVCVRKRESDAIAQSVAPALGEVGIMLPYTPLHQLLLEEGPGILVMTSGNVVDEPVVIGNDEALASLSGIADAFLLHDRPILRRADDSVVRVVSSEGRLIRRSRGFVPDEVTLPFEAPAVLAVGAELKNTICVTRGNRAFLSQHIGDLSHPHSSRFFEETIESMRSFAGVEPVVIAHDLHPDYRSTRWAMSRSTPRIGVQHHHAHIASCLAENGRTDRVIGVAFDGTGCGPAGELWGGELLICDLESSARAGHLRPIALAGGEAAIREPWRLAAAALLDAGEPLDLLHRVAGKKLLRIRQLIEQRIRAPQATSAGRWFDAVAAMCGLCNEITFEAQGAMLLETVAASGGDPYPFELSAGNEIDLRPAVRAIAADLRAQTPPGTIAGRFHQTLIAAVTSVCDRLRQSRQIETVALSGGCFQNRLLTEGLKKALEQRSFEVLLHGRIPANDGGIALGQAAVAAFRMRGLN